MKRVLSELFEHWNRYKIIATTLIGFFLMLNTLVIYLTGGIPSAFAHTMYIPVLIAAFYYGAVVAGAIGLIAGFLVGPLMRLDVLGVSIEPWANSLYRTGYFVLIGVLVGVLFRFLQERLRETYKQTEKLDATFMAIGEGVVTTDKDGNISKINHAAEAILGKSAKDIWGLPFWEVFTIVDATTKEAVVDPIREVLRTHERFELAKNALLIDAFGNEHPIEDSAMPIKDQDGQLMGTVLVFRDVSRQLQADREIYLDKQRLERIVDSSADIIFEIGLDGKYISIFGKGLKKIGHSVDAFLNKDVLDIFGDEGKDRSEYYLRALQGETVVYEWDFSKNGNTLHFESSISPIYDLSNQIIGAVGIARDITDKKLKQKEIEHISFHDFLTGLHNRRYFAEMLAQYDHPNNYPLGIMMIDFNGLKIINDAFGHELGDRALIAVAKLLRTIQRKHDVLARIGGDEFAFILPKTTDDEINALKNAIMTMMESRTVRSINLSLAIGYAIKEDDGDAIGEIMNQAENEMYRRKLVEGISARNNSIKAILKTLTKKYTEERVHSERVSNLCTLVGKALELPPDDVKELEMAGMYHDIGKISLPDAILKKNGKLTDEEYAIVKGHTNNGYQILRAADDYSMLAQTVLYHHEWYNGKGYPEGLKGEEIPLYSRIISVADAYEAMTSNRPYRAAITHDAALKELKAYAGSQFDPDIVEVFINHIDHDV